MNLKLLEKLVRLANNNPNENEANLAARKVCKLIEEGNFRFNQTVEIPISKQYKPATYADVTRSKEPQWKSTPPQSTGDHFWDFVNNNPHFKDIFNRVNNEFYGGGRGGGKTSRNYDIPKEPFYDPFTGRQNQNRPKQKRTCSKCGKEVETARITNIFNCNECEWNAYQENQSTTKVEE